MILLLTGCINPNGMIMTALSNQEERKSQYIKAIRFYLSNTEFPIVFSENSGSDISLYFQDAIESGRMEYLTFLGNENKKRGKGYGECEIIEYSLNHSKLIQASKDQRIIKITGRLIVKNITSIIRWHQLFFSKKTVFCSINSDLSFPDSRLIVAPISFYRAFLHSKEKINDSKGYFFEHVLLDTLKREINFPYSPFIQIPSIEGISGSTGEKYNEEMYTFSFAVKYARHTISLRNRFKLLYRKK